MKKLILNTLIEHLTDVKPQLDIYSNNARFKEDLEIDSIDMAEFIARVEQDYRLEIPDNDWPKIATINSLVDYIRDARS